MSATTSTATPGEQSFAVARPALWSETWELYKRGLRKTLRRPIVIYFSVLQPLILLGLFGQMFSRMVTFPGVGAAFGTTSYTAFFTPSVIMLTLLFGAGQSGL